MFQNNKIVLDAGRMRGRLDDRPDVRQISHTRKANKNMGMCELALWPLVQVQDEALNSSSLG